MTTGAFIDYIGAEHPQQVKELATFNGIKLDRPVMNMKLDKVYELARIMDIDAPDLVHKIIQTELMS